jgi:DNA-binding MarR family transcriptional regulator
MKKRVTASPPRMPKRKELSDTPVKLCCEISRLFHTRLRESGNIDGIMSQPGARLVLSLLAIKDGISQKELVNETHLRPPSVSVIIKKMADEDIVRIETDKNDLRVTRIYLTEHGKDIDRSHIERIKNFDAIAHASLSDEETQTLMLLLSKIRSDLLDDNCRKDTETRNK